MHTISVSTRDGAAANSRPAGPGCQRAMAAQRTASPDAHFTMLCAQRNGPSADAGSGQGQQAGHSATPAAHPARRRRLRTHFCSLLSTVGAVSSAGPPSCSVPGGSASEPGKKQSRAREVDKVADGSSAILCGPPAVGSGRCAIRPGSLSGQAMAPPQPPPTLPVGSQL